MGISVTQLLIILVIVIVIFGTKRLRTVGTDLGGAIKNFRQALADSEKETPSSGEHSKNNTSADPDDHK